MIGGQYVGTQYVVMSLEMMDDGASQCTVGTEDENVFDFVFGGRLMFAVVVVESCN